MSYMGRLREWWRRSVELDTMDRCEMERIAGDLGMRGSDLKALAVCGPHAADQLRDRMRLLSIASADVERVAPGLMRDLERTCTRCTRKATCRRDLAKHPQDASWGGYCPNAGALTAIRNAMLLPPA
jgi:hypothetical protein